MYTYAWYHWLTFFYIYCFFGWIFESTYVSLKQHRFVNRGFLRLPMLPLYGTGAVMMLWVSLPVKNNLFLVYCSGVVAATLLEYVTGYVMERLFKVRYWDYSNQKFNLHGYICLTSSIAWGFLTIFMTEVIHKPMERFVLNLPPALEWCLLGVISGCFVMDTIQSTKEALNLAKALERVAKLRADLDEMQVQLALLKAETAQNIETAKEELRMTVAENIESGKEMAAARKEALEEAVAAGKEKLAETAAVQKERLTEAASARKERLTEAASAQKEALATAAEIHREAIAARKEELAEAVEAHKETIAARKEEFAETLEVHRENVAARKEKFAEALEAHRENVAARKEELAAAIDLKKASLAARISSLNEKIADTNRLLKNQKTIGRPSILRRNPSAVSRHFADAWKELYKE